MDSANVYRLGIAFQDLIKRSLTADSRRQSFQPALQYLVAELGETAVGKRAVPDRATSTIIFSSHGLAIADVAVSAAAYQLVRQQGLGSEIELTLGAARTEIVTAGARERARR